MTVRQEETGIDGTDERGGGFDDFYRANYAWVRQLAMVLVGSDAVAQDVAHDAFVAVYDRFDGIANPAAYLRIVTVNACRRFYRRRARDQERCRLASGDDVVLPDETIELLSGVRHLPYRQQVVLVLRYWARLPFADIAVTLNCPVATVRSMHHRALTALRKEFT